MISAQSENKEILSEDGLLEKLETEKQKRLLAVWLCAGLFAPIVVISVISIAGASFGKMYSLRVKSGNRQ